MNKRMYVCYNGAISTLSEVSLSVENRSFRYGDAIFETIRAFGTQMPLFSMHFERLLRGLAALQMDVNGLPTQEVIQKKIESVIIKNKFFKSSRIRLSVYRNDGGLYTPATNTCSYLIEVTQLNSDVYELNEKGLFATCYDEMFKMSSIISPYKTANSLLFVLAGIHKNKQNVTEVLIQNHHGLIVEALASNLFWIKDKVLYTPSISSGCVDGIMRAVVLQIVDNLQIPLKEVDGVLYDILKESDEIFVTNAVQGINWIVGIDDRRYYNNMTMLIYRSLIQKIKSDLNK